VRSHPPPLAERRSGGRSRAFGGGLDRVAGGQRANDEDAAMGSCPASGGPRCPHRPRASPIPATVHRGFIALRRAHGVGLIFCFIRCCPAAGGRGRLKMGRPAGGESARTVHRRQGSDDRESAGADPVAGFRRSGRSCTMSDQTVRGPHPGDYAVARRLSSPAAHGACSLRRSNAKHASAHCARAPCRPRAEKR